jgi:hypothetical protein
MNTTTVCNSAAGAKSGAVALGPDTLGSITFAPPIPQLGVTLQLDMLLEISSRCAYYDGTTTELR